jgi:hypothetical protein
VCIQAGARGKSGPKRRPSLRHLNFFKLDIFAIFMLAVDKGYAHRSLIHHSNNRQTQENPSDQIPVAYHIPRGRDEIDRRKSQRQPLGRYLAVDLQTLDCSKFFDAMCVGIECACDQTRKNRLRLCRNIPRMDKIFVNRVTPPTMNKT